MAEEGKKIAKAESAEGMDYENALVIICFRFAGAANVFIDDEIKYKLLDDFAQQIKTLTNTPYYFLPALMNF